MEKKDHKIHIIGAGISGLIAALILERHGYQPVVIEATDRVGGRVKTDIVNGYQLDHGFQVLLTAYPAAQNYLDLEALELQRFLPGAAIFKDGKINVLGDPLRNIRLLLPTLFSGTGTLADKIKVLKLNSGLKRSTLPEIFEKPEKTTMQYLQDLGFSEKMIEEFFRPFFGGIFLEPRLETPSRMFEFVYKMFGEGYAALPKAGMEAIPKQIKGQLKNTRFLFNTKARSVSDGQIVLADGTSLESDYTIIATAAGPLVSNLKNQDIQWVSCDTLYFETGAPRIKKHLIGLIAQKDALINNIFYHTSLPSISKGERHLLSVTVVKEHQLSAQDLIDQVRNELKTLCNIDTLSLLKHYSISQALPQLNGLHYEMLPSETQLTTTIFLAGDYLLNGSLNAAMLSGERAALGVAEKIG
ncbi:NAD(P)/FAD-dependent oxidoreductase [Robertkochia flava]|uniref:NAD(P)/FAD-dependent oxidoreductase n=1 Tax=Robertkochia flava TaxID=3447986 RepID=UPI001CC9520F|nr:NAD(P)/FAD-dependent oxidoreductase [Robertkochia marina]